MYSQKEIENKLRDIAEGIDRANSDGMNALLAPEPCGAEVERMSAKIRFKAQDWEKNQRGEMHGGAISAMFDTAMGMTVLTYSDYKEISTADLNVSFIRPFKGASYIFDTEIINLGTALVRIRAVAYDEETKKCLASATANFVHFG